MQIVICPGIDVAVYYFRRRLTRKYGYNAIFHVRFGNPVVVGVVIRRKPADRAGVLSDGNQIYAVRFENFGNDVGSLSMIWPIDSGSLLNCMR